MQENNKKSLNKLKDVILLLPWDLQDWKSELPHLKALAIRNTLRSKI